MFLLMIEEARIHDDGCPYFEELPVSYMVDNCPDCHHSMVVECLSCGRKGGYGDHEGMEPCGARPAIALGGSVPEPDGVGEAWAAALSGGRDPGV